MNELAKSEVDATSSRVGVFLALALALALRAYGLQGQTLSSDEVIEASIARLDLRDIVTYSDGFPPLYHVLLAGWTKAFPEPESGRWPSVLAGVATVYAVGRWATQSVNSRAGLFATVLAAVSPLHVYLSQEMRAYSLYICLATFAMMFFFEAMKTDRRRSWLGFVVSAALAVNTHYYAGLLAALLGLLLVFYRPRWSQMRRGAIAFLAVVVCSTPAVALLPGDVAYQSEGFALKAPLLRMLGHTAYALFAGFSVGPSLGELHVLSMRDGARSAAPWVAAFGAVGIWLLWHGWQELRRRPYGLGIIFLAVASAPLIGAAGALVDVGPKVRYWSWILMPLLVWLSAGAARGWNARGGWITRVAFLMLVSLQLLALANRYANPRYANEDMRMAAAYLRQNAARSQPIFVVADYMGPLVRYYMNGEPALYDWLPHVARDDHGKHGRTRDVQATVKWVVHPRTEQDVRGSDPFDEAAIEEWLAAVRALAADDGQFWLLYSRDFHGDRGGNLLNYLKDHHLVRLDREFPGIKLYRGRLPASP
jgi:hypothetical protein